MSLTGILILQLLKGKTSALKYLVIQLQIKLHLAVGEDIAVLVFFGVKYKYFNFLD